MLEEVLFVLSACNISVVTIYKFHQHRQEECRKQRTYQDRIATRRRLLCALPDIEQVVLPVLWLRSSRSPSTLNNERQ